jgi:hypothetical protein
MPQNMERVVLMPAEQAAREQLAEEYAQLMESPPSETVPGGEYIKADGRLVDANGREKVKVSKDAKAAMKEMEQRAKEAEKALEQATKALEQAAKQATQAQEQVGEAVTEAEQAELEEAAAAQERERVVASQREMPAGARKSARKQA